MVNLLNALQVGDDEPATKYFAGHLFIIKLHLAATDMADTTPAGHPTPLKNPNQPTASGTSGNPLSCQRLTSSSRVIDSSI